MARIARLVEPRLPNLVTRCGNRRGKTFFEDDDYALYRDLLAEASARAGKVRVGGDGRGASIERGALCVAQPGPVEVGQTSESLEMVKRAGASGRQGRRRHADRAGA